MAQSSAVTLTALRRPAVRGVAVTGLRRVPMPASAHRSVEAPAISQPWSAAEERRRSSAGATREHVSGHQAAGLYEFENQREKNEDADRRERIEEERAVHWQQPGRHDAEEKHSGAQHRAIAQRAGGSRTGSDNYRPSPRLRWKLQSTPPPGVSVPVRCLPSCFSSAGRQGTS